MPRSEAAAATIRTGTSATKGDLCFVLKELYHIFIERRLCVEFSWESWVYRQRKDTFKF